MKTYRVTETRKYIDPEMDGISVEYTTGHYANEADAIRWANERKGKDGGGNGCGSRYIVLETRVTCEGAGRLTSATAGKMMFLDGSEWASDMYDRVVVCRADAILDRDTGATVAMLTDEAVVDDVWADYCDCMERFPR